jgi:YVTN family beta-propeller protein
MEETMRKFQLLTMLTLTLYFTNCEDTIVDPPVSQGDKIVYILNSSAETISKINMEDTTVVQNMVTTGSIPNRIRIHQDHLYIVNSGDDNVLVIDLENDTQIAHTIGLKAGDNPWDIEFNGAKAYVSNYSSHTISVIDLNLNKEIKRINVGYGPEGMLITNDKLYIAVSGNVGYPNPREDSRVDVIDLNAEVIIDSIITPLNPQELALAPDGILHVLCSGEYAANSGKIAMLDISGNIQLIDSLKIGGFLGDLEITKDGVAYCLEWGNGVNGFLYAYHTKTNAIIHDSQSPIKVGPNLMQFEYDEIDNLLWIPYMTAWGGDGYLQIFDPESNKIVWTSSIVGNGSGAVAVYRKNK